MADNIKNVLTIVNEKFANIEAPAATTTAEDRKMAENIIGILEGYALGDAIVEDNCLEFDECEYFFNFSNIISN